MKLHVRRTISDVVRASHDELLVHVPGQKRVTLGEQDAVANVVLDEPAQRRAVGGDNVLVGSLRDFVGFRSRLRGKFVCV